MHVQNNPAKMGTLISAHLESLFADGLVFVGMFYACFDLFWGVVLGSAQEALRWNQSGHQELRITTLNFK